VKTIVCATKLNIRRTAKKGRARFCRVSREGGDGRGLHRCPTGGRLAVRGKLPRSNWTMVAFRLSTLLPQPWPRHRTDRSKRPLGSRVAKRTWIAPLFGWLCCTEPCGISIRQLRLAALQSSARKLPQPYFNSYRSPTSRSLAQSRTSRRDCNRRLS